MSDLPTGDWPTRIEAATDWATHQPVVPGYEILEELGRGGMGVVYKARQESSNRLVALKVIRDAALAGPQERARFRIEAEAAARVRHPNVVQVYEVGEHQGRPYFAMEFVGGGSLAQYLAQHLAQHLPGQLLPVRQAAELVRTLALAIQHAHEQKVVHRDLKPANILLQNDECPMTNDQRMTNDQSPMTKEANAFRHSSLGISHSLVIGHWTFVIPKITDFGLAKRLDSESTAWTQDGAVLGTASYMAPEQAAGRIREVGPGVDVFALGAILYELLTGRPPFQADTFNQTIEQVLHDEPTPPTRLRSDVPRDLETICLKCLEKELSRRYATAGELADDVGRFLEGRSVAAVPLSAADRLARLAARDGYRLLEEIGRGPRSTVYRALSGPLEQPVALKVFFPGTCTREEWEARLRRGAELWAALAHPQVVPVQRAGWWDGAGFLALEYVPHGSLADKLSGQRYPLGQALQLVEQLAEIVSYLHRQGVVHGNLKPSNVLLAADGVPRVVDFRPTGGLFQGLDRKPDRSPHAPREDSLHTERDAYDAGLAYLPPELVRDSAGEPRPYTDVYGLGVILYELLTGRPPFAGADARETLEQVRSQDPAPPSRLNSEVTPLLEACCLRCLRKNPWRRYYRVHDLLSRLRHFQSDSESRAAPGGRSFKRRPPGS